MATWQQQWESLLIQQLEENGIGFEKTGFSIAQDIKLYRDNDWEEIFKSGQVVEVLPPLRKGDDLELKAINANGLPVIVGSVRLYHNEKKYLRGIICQLFTKDLKYSNGEIRNCLAFDQGVILIEANELPLSILKNKTLSIKSKGEKMNVNTNGGWCGILTIVILILFGLFLFSCEEKQSSPTVEEIAKEVVKQQELKELENAMEEELVRLMVKMKMKGVDVATDKLYQLYNEMPIDSFERRGELITLMKNKYK